MAGNIQRRLAAIVLADVVGYSRLMGADETGTLEAMRAHRLELWDPTIERFGGRLVNRAGDSALVEFGSAVAAIECSLAIQEAMAERNADVPDEKRVQLRVGVNIGEVVVEGDEIYGDGVNIAARLQTLADPGKVCISASVYDQISGKLEVDFVDLGELTLKNIGRPVRAYAVNATGARPPIAVSVAEGTFDAATAGAIAKELLQGAGGPTVAVLPFRNVSQDPSQEFFVDGLTEDIILGLSASRSFRVLASSATYKYKDLTTDPQTAGEELKANYVLVGNVRRAGNRLRVSVELINVETKVLLWSERYDRSLEDLFEVQDDITTTAVAIVEPEIDAHEMRRVLVSQHPVTMNAYELAQRGFWHLGKRSPDAYQSSLALFESSRDADPNYPRAYAGMAQAKYTAGLRLWGLDDIQAQHKAALEDAIRFGRMTLDLDQQDPRGLRYFGSAQALTGHYDVGLEALRRAITVHPSYATAYSALGYALMLVGDFEGAMTSVATTERLRPGDPNIGVCIMAKAASFYQLGDYESAARVSEQSRALNDQFWFSHLMFAASLGQLNKISEARAVIETTNPSMSQVTTTADGLYKLLPFKDRAHLEHIVEGLHKAGH